MGVHLPSEARPGERGDAVGQATIAERACLPPRTFRLSLTKKWGHARMQDCARQAIGLDLGGELGEALFAAGDGDDRRAFLGEVVGDLAAHT